jgi:hypothetical protein
MTYEIKEEDFKKSWGDLSEKEKNFKIVKVTAVPRIFLLVSVSEEELR